MSAEATWFLIGYVLGSANVVLTLWLKTRRK